MLIGIASDYPGAGKMYMARKLVDALGAAKIYTFDRPLKQLIHDLFAIDCANMTPQQRTEKHQIAIPPVYTFHRVIRALMLNWAKLYNGHNGLGIYAQARDAVSNRNTLIIANQLRAELISLFSMADNKELYVSAEKLMNYVGYTFFKEKINQDFWLTLLRGGINKDRSFNRIKFALIPDIKHINDIKLLDKLVYIRSPHNENSKEGVFKNDWTCMHPDFILTNHYNEDFDEQIKGMVCQLLEKK